MDDRIDVLGAMAEASPKVRVVRAHRQLCHGDGRRPFHAVGSLVTNREGSSLLYPKYRSDCDVRGFPTVETIVDGGIHSGHEVTNFHPICDGSKLVHEAMKSKSGATHLQHLLQHLACIFPPPRSQLAFSRISQLKVRLVACRR